MTMRYFLSLLVIGLYGIHVAGTTSCDVRETNDGLVCVCTAAFCDYLTNPQPSGVNDFTVVSSSKGGLRFSATSGTFGQTVSIEDRSSLVQMIGGFGNGVNSILVSAFGFPKTKISVKLNINRNERYQKISGFGGAFTGSVSHILAQLPVDLQDHVYNSYFHKDGIGYNMIRMSIGGSDFDLNPWAYNEQPRNDGQLTNFSSLDPLDELKIQQLTRMKSVAELEGIKIMAAAWSPPTWMKSNNQWTGFSFLKPEYYQTWANYHLKFIELMDAKNMPIWAISTGNEPLNGVIGWVFVRFMSLGWTPRDQAIWLSENLGPTIRNSKHKNVLIFSNDDQRYTYPGWFQDMKDSRANSLNYLDGLAVHWYWDKLIGPKNIDDAHRDMPDKLILNTESCIGDKPWEVHGPLLGSWERGESYIQGYLQDLQHSVNGWIDWNLVLNEQGGPNYVDNFVDAAIIVNTTNKSEFFKQPIYYAIGHFSKFLPEGSVRIAAQVSPNSVDVVAFSRPDGTIAVILFNGNDASVDVALTDSVRGNFVSNIPARSVHTIVYN